MMRDRTPSVAMIEAAPANADVSLPNNGASALQAAHRIGLRTVLVTRDRARYRGSLDGHVDSWVTAETASTEQVAEQLALVVPDVVFSWVDALVPTAHRVAELLGLAVGPGSPAVHGDKAAVRERLDKHGIVNAAWHVVDANDPPRSSPIGYPAVLKPIDASASKDTALVTDDEQFQALCRQHTRRSTYGYGTAAAGRLLCEQHLDGPLVSLEGMVADGRVSFWGLHDRTLSPPPGFVETSSAFHGCTVEDRALTDYAREVIAALEYRTGPFHLECIRTEHGPVLVEINARLAGGGLHQNIDLATGGSCAEATLRGYLGDSPALAEPVRASCLMHLTVEQPGTLARIDGVEKAGQGSAVARIVPAIRPGEHVVPTGSNADRILYALCSGQDRAESRQHAHDALSHITMVWE